jgi:short-subunit dehydrogenase
MRAVVTGAGRGLGAAIVDALQSAGYEVVATDIVGTEVRLDVTDAQACRALAQQVKPQVWVNNAAVLGAGDAATQSQQVVEQVVAVNLLGTINGTRAAVEVMRQRDSGRGQGHVITIGSLASWVPVPGETVYAATKAALLSYTLGLRAELKAQGVGGIRFSVVCPDGMLTPMIAEELHNPAVAMSFSGLRTIEPEQVAARVVDLLQRPRLVSSVPHWRGAMVRVLSAAPDQALRLSGLFAALGDANRRKAAARSGSGRAVVHAPPSRD